MLWDYVCDKNHVEEHWTTDRNWQPLCKECSGIMYRQLGGRGMLWFEEGRGREMLSLGERPFTSYKQVEKAARAIGATHSGDTVPPSVAKNPKSIGMQRYLNSGKQKGRWV